MPAQALQVGVELFGHRLMRLLGRGPFAEVWLAEREGRSVALKIFRESLDHDPYLAHRFMHEARLLIAFDHPHIVRAHRFHHDSGRGAFAMEVLDGQTLRRFLDERARQNRPLSMEQVLTLFEQLLSALQYAHDRGVVHRDLKPENVFVVQDEPIRIKVIDFGLARLVDDGDADATTLGRRLGSWPYMAPEQALGQPVGPAADLFTAASLMFEVLTLRQAWVLDSYRRPRPLPTDPADDPERSWQAILHRIAGGVRPLDEMVGEAARLRPVAARAWSELPEDRYADGAEMWTAMAAATQDPDERTRVDPPPPPPATQVVRARNPPRRTDSEAEEPSSWKRPHAPDASPEPPESPSQVRTSESDWVGRYRLERPIGKGGFGQVWTARDVRSHARVALKLIPYRVEKDVLFHDEVQAVGALDHPHIVRLLDYGRERDRFFMAMSLIPGPALSALLRNMVLAREQMSEAAGRYLLRAMAGAFDHAFYEARLDGHPVALVHRDVSPQNMLLDGTGQVFLTDFGVAKTWVQHHRTEGNVIHGKPAYMSPEQIRYKSLDVRSDYFGLGVVVWEALAGRRLFKDSSHSATLERVLHDVPQPIRSLRSDVSSGMDAALGALLLKDRSERPGTWAEVEALLGPGPDPELGRQHLADMIRRYGLDAPGHEPAAGSDPEPESAPTVTPRIPPPSVASPSAPSSGGQVPLVMFLVGFAVMGWMLALVLLWTGAPEPVSHAPPSGQVAPGQVQVKARSEPTQERSNPETEVEPDTVSEPSPGSEAIGSQSVTGADPAPSRNRSPPSPVPARSPSVRRGRERPPARERAPDSAPLDRYQVLEALKRLQAAGVPVQDLMVELAETPADDPRALQALWDKVRHRRP